MKKDKRLPLLWVHGPPGVGKSTTGWRIFEQLQRQGFRAGFVDIDQLGIYYPESAADPGRHNLKVANLAALAANFTLAGCQAMIVSGVVNPARGMDLDPALLHTVTVVSCRLRLRSDALARRLRRRGDAERDVEATLVAAEQIERLGQEPAVDVEGLTVDEVAGRVREVVGGWPPEGAISDSPPRTAPRVAGGAPVLWVCGPPAVGKSTVGFEVYRRLLATGTPTAYLDLAQIGWLRPHAPGDPLNHQLKMANLASVWAAYQAAGAAGLVMTGPVEQPSDVPGYADAVAGSRLVVCQLQAGPDTLRQRVVARGRAEGWQDASDSLNGADGETLERAWRQAVTTAAALRETEPGDCTIPTDDRPPGEIAQDILDTCWSLDVRRRPGAAG